MTELDSLIKQVNLVIDPPSLNDTASDLDRFKKSLSPLLENRPLQASLAALRELGPALREGKWQVAATIADIGDSWRLVRVESTGIFSRLWPGN